MSARNLGPPGNGAGAHGEAGAGEVETLGGGRTIPTFSHRADDVPLHRSVEFDALDPDDPRRWQSTVRAADAWYAEGTDEAIRSRLLDELEVADLIARWRVRMAGHDVRGDTDWVRIFDVVQARREVAA
jgi:hypothetical protein